MRAHFSLCKRLLSSQIPLQRGGRTIYAGPLGKQSSELVAYFQAIPGVPKIKGNINPATWMLEISTRGMEERMGVNFADIYEQSKVMQYALFFHFFGQFLS